MADFEKNVVYGRPLLSYWPILEFGAIVEFPIWVHLMFNQV